MAIAVAAMVFGSLAIVALPRPANAGLCEPGWRLMSTTTNSFSYGPDQQGRRVVWTGAVSLYERYDRNCDIIQIELDYTGSSGGTLTMTGFIHGVSFTVQHPSPYSDYNDVWRNRKGDIVYSNPPPGNYGTYSIEIIDGVNSDEYLVRYDNTATTTVGSVHINFGLGLNLIGQTVYAEINVGGGLNLNNSWVSVFIPT